MKNFYTTLALLMMVSFVFAVPKNTAKTNNGRWGQNSDWTLNRVPADNDTIVIPANFVFRVDNNNSLNNVVIKVYGALILNGGKLNLDNASQVIVETGGSVIGSTSSDQIKIGNTHKFKGSDPMITGPAFSSSITGSAPNGFSALSSLPVKFNSFFVNHSGKDVIVSWSTSDEINNSHFEVERSFDGQNWIKIAVVFGEASSNQINSYSYTDRKVSSAISYYRIRQVDVDGRSQYTQTRVVRNNEVAQKTNIYASSKSVTVSFNEEIKGNFAIRVINMNGQVVSQQAYNQSSYKITLALNNTTQGIYTVQVLDNKGWSEMKKVSL